MSPPIVHWQSFPQAAKDHHAPKTVAESAPRTVAETPRDLRGVSAYDNPGSRKDDQPGNFKKNEGRAPGAAFLNSHLSSFVHHPSGWLTS
jgi:hypothetical protein